MFCQWTKYSYFTLYAIRQLLDNLKEDTKVDQKRVYLAFLHIICMYVHTCVTSKVLVLCKSIILAMYWYGVQLISLAPQTTDQKTKNNEWIPNCTCANNSIFYVPEKRKYWRALDLPSWLQTRISKILEGINLVLDTAWSLKIARC